MKRKRGLTAAELRALGANPDRVRRVIPPDGRQRVEAAEPPKRGAKNFAGGFSGAGDVTGHGGRGGGRWPG